MTGKTYYDIHTIMGFSRIFADQMYKAMKNCGLLDAGYGLSIKIGHYGGEDVTEMVVMEQDILKIGGKQWDETLIDQKKLKDEGWRVFSDPLCRGGAIPPVVSVEKTGRRAEERRETAGKPYPPDGLWISADHYRDDMGGGC
jgi:hypothetical protein